MKSKTYNIPSVGDIIITKHHQTNRITLKLKAGQPPKVVIPKLMTYSMGFRFALEKEDWIITHLNKLSKNKKLPALYNEQNNFKTRYKSIQFKCEGNKLKVSNTNDIITLIFPNETNINNEKYQLLIKNFIIETLRKEAKQHLTKQIEHYASTFGFKYNKIFIKNLKSRWGSCSASDNINLNLHLMRLPEHLSDFVVLHELCHTVHKNHGPKFHELLNTISGNEKLLNKELKKYTIDL